jgi:hypothetical protein
MRYAQHVRLRISTAASVFLGWNAGVYQSLLVVAEIPSADFVNSGMLQNAYVFTAF